MDPQRVADALRDDTCLVSVMLANNEIGVLQSIKSIAELYYHARGIPVRADATQAVGKIPVDVNDLDVDLMSFTAAQNLRSQGNPALSTCAGCGLISFA